MANNDFGRLQPVEYDQYPASPPTKAASTPKQPKSPSKKASTGRLASSGSTSKYNAETLNKIGDDCKNRLPPASAVQAMFLYECQRKTESEEVFQGLMFKLAQEEAAAAEEKDRVKGMEKRLIKLEREAVRAPEAKNFVLKAHNEKLKALSDSLDDKYGAHLARVDNIVDTLSDKLAHVTSELQNIQTQIVEASAAAAAHQAEMEAKQAERNLTTASDPIVNTIQTELDALFIDRNNILTMVEENKTRITKVEENTRALTLQRAAPANSAAASPHRLPLTASHSNQLELGVPKGMGLKKENGSRK